MMHGFIALVHEIAQEGEANVSHSELWLTTVKPGYMLGGCTPTLRSLELKKDISGKPEDYKRRLQRLFFTHSYGRLEKQKTAFCWCVMVEMIGIGSGVLKYSSYFG